MEKIRRISQIDDNSRIKISLKKLYIKIRELRISNYLYIEHLFKAKSGLEIGGPSKVFRNLGFIPLYKIINSLDGCNFSNTTIWEGNIATGENYKYYNNKKGYQYVSEATNLSLIPNSKYDFVISSNCLEHVANPLKAIQEWIRVIKNDGLILIVLPNKNYCFDHYRPITEFSHLLNDFQENVNEEDLTHLGEILKLHDLKLDKRAGGFDNFWKRSLSNIENRTLHHHVFSISILEEIFNYFNIKIILTHEGKELTILGMKPE